MLNFLKKLFGIVPSFGMGSLPSPADSRNIDIASIQTPVSIPDLYITDISILGIENQGSKSTCVGCSMSKLGEYYVYKNTGKIVHFDPDALYVKCKKEDGIPFQNGTYAVVGAKIVVRDGINELNTLLNTKFTTGYAFVSHDFQSICQAIYQNGMVSVGLYIDTNWFLGIIGRALRFIGGHETDLHGFDVSQGLLYGVNSWGIGWVGQVAGYVDPNVKPGRYVAKYDDIKSSIINIISFLPIPKTVINDIKNTGYRFFTTMKLGSIGYEIKKLQEYFQLKADGQFGLLTQAKVKQFQSQNNLLVDGVVGKQMRAKLNVGTASFIPQWIEAIKIMEGAKPERNNPGNIRFIGQKYAVDDNGYCKFDTYEHGYEALKTLLINACTGKSLIYYPEMTLVNFYHKYAPSSDGNNPSNYGNFVIKKLGVLPTTTIVELL